MAAGANHTITFSLSRPAEAPFALPVSFGACVVRSVGTAAVLLVPQGATQVRPFASGFKFCFESLPQFTGRGCSLSL
jgi:hypothetical protein